MLAKNAPALSPLTSSGADASLARRAVPIGSPVSRIRDRVPHHRLDELIQIGHEQNSSSRNPHVQHPLASIRFPSVTLLALTLACITALVAPSSARAGMAACSSAAAKSNVDEKIRLYTLCIENGGMSRQALSSAFNNRGLAYQDKGEIDLALADFDKAVRYDPKFALGYFNHAFIHIAKGNVAAAIEDLTATIARPPARVRADALAWRGVMYLSQGNCGRALADFEKAVRLNRKLAWAHSSRAWTLATCPDEQFRNGTEALEHAQKALALQDHWRVHDVLAAAYAEAGRFDDSVREARIALEQASAEGAQWKPALEARLALYMAGKPFRDTAEDAQSPSAWAANVY